MTTLFAFVIVLGILIFIHELGHFLFAKLNGVGVLKFSLGFGPALVKKRVGETEYQISVIPLGGYVKMLGEGSTPEDEFTPMDPEKSFAGKGLGVRALIVAAGPVFNLLLAIVIYMVIGWTGIPTIPPVVGEVMDGTPAETAGLMPGDRIVSIQGSPVQSWEDISIIMQENEAGENVQFVIERGGTDFTVNATPIMIKDKNLFGEEIERPMIGISRSEEVVMKHLGFFPGIGYGFTQTWKVIELTGIGVWKMIDGTLDIRDSLGGPILIAQVSGETFRAGILPFFSMIAFVSINLFLINLLPIPVLDGGHLMLFGIEAAIGKPVEGRPREIAQQIGLFLLILLMILAFYNDLARLFQGG
ncbi:MAG: RIP metalloprotease RseP [Desulfomonilia bacterium]|jgi:regulator of sigma E protease|nr:RIP metalloprotease RseP [Desulfomonilia bacterium]